MKRVSALFLLSYITGMYTSLLAGTIKNEGANFGFTANNGQVCDQNNKLRSDVLFGGTDGLMTYFIKKNGVSYQLSRTDTWKEKINPKTKEKKKVPNQTTIYRVDVDWLNVNTTVVVQTGEAFSSYTNYYLPHCPQGILNVKTYEEITLKNIYKGIDLHYYFKQGTLKYDYIVSPNTDYRQIKLKVNGAKIEIQKDGSLLLRTPVGNIREGTPIAYQDGKPLKTAWKKEGCILSFSIEGYDPHLPLTIDPPTRVWGTYYGGYVQENFETCATRGQDVYAVGTSASASGTLATIGSFQHLRSGTTDALLVKFNSAGVKQWATFYGGTYDDSGSGVSIDNTGNVYVTGETWSFNASAIATPTAYQAVHSNTYTSNADAFLVKFNAAGARIWGTYYGGANYDTGISCSTDRMGNVYMSGNSSSLGGITTTGSYQPFIIGNTPAPTAFLVKFDSLGARQWGTYYGYYCDCSPSCAVDSLNNVYLAGCTRDFATSPDPLIATPGAHQTIPGDFLDAFLVKFDPAGARQWGTFYGGLASDFISSCSVDKHNNVFISGNTASTGTTIATPGSHQPSWSGNNDAFLVKFSASGVRQWGTYYGGPGAEYGLSCANDTSGNVYLSGRTDSNTGTVIATAGSHQGSMGGSNDAFFAKFDSLGIRQWGTYYGGTGDDIGTSCAVNLSGNYYLAGYTYSTSGSSTAIATPGSVQPNTGSTNFYNGFLAKFIDCTPSLPAAIFGSTLLCPGSGATVYSITAVSGATSYSWTTPAGWASSISQANIYTVTPGASGILGVSATNTCGTGPSQTVNINVAPSPTVTVNSGTICPGGSFVIVPAGANTYSVSGNTFTVNPTSSATYSIIGTSTAGCLSANTATSSVFIETPHVIIASSGTICSGSAYTITPAGAANYVFSSGTATVSPAATTSYSVTGTSALGCPATNTAVLTVTVYSNPTITVNSGTLCNGQSFTLSPTGAYTYTFNGGSAIVSPSVTSDYSVTGTNSAGCAASNTAIASVTVDASFVITAASGSVCSGQVFTIQPAGAVTYIFSSGSPTVTPSVTESFSVTGINSLGCLSSNTAIATVTVMPGPSVSINSGSVCSGQSFVLQPSGAVTYTFSSGSPTITPSVTGSYSVTGISSLGCLSSNTAIATVTVVQGPNISVNSGYVCSGQSFTLQPIGATGYVFTSGNNVVIPSATSFYSVSGIDINGCVGPAAMATVQVMALPVISLSSNNAIVCVGETANIVVSGALSYTWNTGQTGSAIAVSPGATTSYTVTGTDANGCETIFTVVQQVDNCTGINAASAPSNAVFGVYPNPGNGFFTLSLSSPANVRIFNAIGEIICEISAEAGQTIIDLSGKADGVYFITNGQRGVRIIKN